MNLASYRGVTISIPTGTTGSIVVCVSPLTALMMDQKSKFVHSNIDIDIDIDIDIAVS